MSVSDYSTQLNLRWKWK